MTDEVARRRLVRLIQRRLDEGESTRSIAGRAREHGEKLSHGHVNNLHRGMVAKVPDPDDIRALAAGLNYPESMIQAAVFYDWFGYTPGSADPEQAIRDSSLTDTEKEMLLAQLRVIRERQAEGTSHKGLDETGAESSERFA